MTDQNRIESMTKSLERIAELEKQVEILKTRLKQANDTLARYRAAESRRYQHDSDYLPYEEDRYD